MTKVDTPDECVYEPAFKLGHLATLSFPSKETDREQIVRSLSAVTNVHPHCDLVVPVSKRQSQTGHTIASMIQSYYGVEDSLNVIGYRGFAPIWLDAQRILHVLLVSRHLGRYDVVHTRSRGVVCLCVFKRKPVVFETYRQLQHTNPIFARLLRVVSRWSAFKGVICHSKLCAQSILEIGVSPQKIAVLYNGYDNTMFRSAASQRLSRTETDASTGSLLIVYAGNVQKGKGIEMLLAMAQKRPQYDFWIVGGKNRDIAPLKALAQEMDVQNAYFKGWVGHSSLARYLKAADVLIIPPTAAPLNSFRRTVLPIKTFLYLGAGRPIVAPDTPDVQEILQDEKTALLVPPDDMEASVGALDRLFNDKRLRVRLSEAAEAKSAMLDWASRARRFLILVRHWLLVEDRPPNDANSTELGALLPFSTTKARTAPRRSSPQ